MTELTVSELLKAATAEKKSNNLAGAVALLRLAYEKARIQEVELSYNDHLRLPKYLFDLGEDSTAWAVLDGMSSLGITGTPPPRSMVSMERHLIFSVMASQLEKDGKFFEALARDTAAYLCWVKALVEQDRLSDIPTEHDLRFVDKRLKKAGALNLSVQIKEIVLAALAKIRYVDIELVERSLLSLCKRSYPWVRLAEVI